MKPAQRTDAAPAGDRWYRQPVAWLAATFLLASLGAVAITIVVAERYPDDALPVPGDRVLTTPLERGAEPPSTAAEYAE